MQKKPDKKVTWRDKLPPHDIEAEKQLLGGVLAGGMDGGVNSSMVKLVSFGLRVEYFFYEKNRKIFEVMEFLFAKGTVIDIISVKQALESMKYLDDICSYEYILEVNDWQTSLVLHHAKIIRNHWILREYYRQVSRMAKLALEVPLDVEEFLTNARGDIHELFKVFNQGQKNKPKTIQSGFTSLVDYNRRVRALEDTDRKFLGMSTGFDMLDFKLSGLKKGELTTVGARISMGKTALMRRIATKVSMDGYRVLYFAWEEGEIGYMMGWVATEGKIKVNNLQNVYAPDSIVEQLDEVEKRIMTGGKDGAPIAYRYDTNPGSLEEAIDKTNEMAAELGGIDLVVFDYLQRIKPKRYIDNETARYDYVVSSISQLATDLDCHCMLGSQCTREAERNPMEFPELRNLYGATAIEAYSDNVLLVWRGEQVRKLAADEFWKGKAVIAVKKVKLGQPGLVPVQFEGHYLRFEDPPVWDEDEYEKIYGRLKEG